MDWVAVVDDDIENLKLAGTILSDHGMRVTALRSGAALIEYPDARVFPHGIYHGNAVAAAG